ncbi:MAG: radical SAM protein [Deltaproteobacteria bacterium]|nr:radical SAM protein [Deltaproteobacteria bacterium]
MIDVSVLYAGLETASKPHRYGKALEQLRVDPNHAHEVAKSARGRRPIVVWNVTRTCNLRCVHCYSDSEAKKYDGELSTDEGKALLTDLAAYKVPAVLFSGGEPLARRDLFELAAFAREQGLHVVLSTNGTLIDAKTAQRLRDVDFSYVGVSLDGMGAVNDRFRGVEGAFEAALAGIRALKAVGQKVGLRLTLTRATFQELDNLFALIERERIDRVCFYHLVPSGRGKGVLDLSVDESRRAIDTILAHTKRLANFASDRQASRRLACASEMGSPTDTEGEPDHIAEHRVEVLTVDNHCDGPYLYMKMLAEGDARADEVFSLLKWNGGALASSGVGIACVSWNGDVHPDQFWRHLKLGNVRERPFTQIWDDTSNPLLAALRDRKPHLTGRCATCRFVDACGGSLRVRADLMTGNTWAPDPGCYLTDAEIAG